MSPEPAAPALVLVNPHAAGGRAGRLEPRLRQALSALPRPATLAAPQGVEAARRLVLAQSPGTRIVLVGGDGTVQPLLAALVQQRAELGLVPLGSGNDTARALGLASMAWPAALAHALQAAATALDLGECRTADGRLLFISSLAAGFDAAVGHRALAGPRWLRGLPRYLLATFGELRALRNATLRVELDGEMVHDGPALFASALNTRTYGGGMPATPAARIDDGRLDALVAGRFGRATTLLMLPRLLAGRHLSHPRVVTRSFELMRASSREPCRLAADGEPGGLARAWEVRVCPGALRAVRGPAQARQSLP